MRTAAAAMDKGNFNEWVHAHTSELLRYAASRVKEPEIAEDLVQLTFIAAWNGREKFAQQSSPRTWLFSILKNKIADHYRKAYRDPVVHGLEARDVDHFTADGRWRAEHMPTEWDLDEQGRVERLQRFLAECLKKLPPHWRAAVEMKYLKEKDAAAICQELGITATNYWQQIHRAKVKLRECISARMASNPEP
ncbi:MAG: sigma-70 family RNA polymerase sigma factor [Flavobacteriales bacterium]|nr:sigma-70 family RNA polymerase sigma factor [Flavobacteriales bacterium]MCB0758724.1 sigma-70 family RNA polymerase sigma factor [Flavobacteriales bacterium]